MKVKSESEVAKSCPTLSDPMDRSLPGSSVYGIFQTRVLEWVVIAFSRCLPYLPSSDTVHHTLCLCIISSPGQHICLAFLLMVFSSVQFSHSVVSDSLQPYEPQPGTFFLLCLYFLNDVIQTHGIKCSQILTPKHVSLV